MPHKLKFAWVTKAQAVIKKLPMEYFVVRSRRYKSTCIEIAFPFIWIEPLYSYTHVSVENAMTSKEHTPFKEVVYDNPDASRNPFSVFE